MKKHQELIVAVRANDMHLIAEDSLYSMRLEAEDFVIAQRAMLENNPEYRQVLPVSIFRHGNKYWAYRRTVKGGESRLHGATTICVGGHMDISDVAFYKDSPRWSQSVLNAAEREIEEEINLDSVVLQTTYLKKMICSSQSEVDKVHLGIITIHDLDGELVSSAEDQLDEIGFVTKEELLNDSQYELESWARIILEQLV